MSNEFPLEEFSERIASRVVHKFGESLVMLGLGMLAGSFLICKYREYRDRYF